MTQEALWLLIVLYDLCLTVFLYRFFGKQGLYAAVLLGIVLANLQGGKVTEFIFFGTSFNVSMGAILYSGIFFATDILNEKFGKDEASKAVMLGFAANVAVMITLVVSTFFRPSSISNSSDEVHNAISILADYSPIFVVGSLTAYLISQRFDVWFFHYLKQKTNGEKLWLRNNLSTIASQLIDSFIYQFTWVLAAGLSIYEAFGLALAKYIFKVFIALIDTIFIYAIKDWQVTK